MVLAGIKRDKPKHLFVGSSPVSATKSVTVVDTISTTVTFYFSPPEKGFPRKTGVLPNIPGNKRSVCPDLLRP